MKTTLITTICLLLLINSLFAQNTHFINHGVIEFEKTSNMYAILSKLIDKDEDEAFLRPLYESYKKTQPQFKTLKSTLTFTDNKTLFTPIEPVDAPSNNYLVSRVPITDQNNTIYTDVASGNGISRKKVFEETFLLKDSTRKINWKITDETREVAGYTCRRANAIVMDSIYVVAFYTDKILVSGGPETFTGLPGMILEVALPHENIIWRATKVSEVSVPENTMVPPKKGKAVNDKEFKATLDGAIKSWGNYGKSFFKAFLL